MKNTLVSVTYYLALAIACLCINCTRGKVYHSPKGYDLNNPVKYNMPEDLHEISGIAFHNRNADTLFAEQDEDGELFYLKPGSYNLQSIKFGKNGDYEDLAISNKQVIMLRSDGVLFTFPFSDIRNTETTSTQKWENLLPAGKYEGMFADDNNKLVYVLCKHCSTDKSTKSNNGYILKLLDNGALEKAGHFSIDLKKIEEPTGIKKITFHPSGLSRNPLSNEWYIISSVNKLLVVADSNWQLKEVFDLNPSRFNRPEGITFDRDNNLYISNEGDKVQPGNVLKFAYKK